MNEYGSAELGQVFQSKECLLRFVAREKEFSEEKDSDAFRKCLKEKTSQWLEKTLHVRFLEDTEKSAQRECGSI